MNVDIQKMKRKLAGMSIKELKNSPEYKVIYDSVKNTNMKYVNNGKIKSFNKLPKKEIVNVILKGGIQTDLQSAVNNTSENCDFFKLKELRQHPNYKIAKQLDIDLPNKNKNETCKAISNLSADTYEKMVKDKIEKNHLKLFEIQSNDNNDLPTNISLLKNTREYKIVYDFFKSTKIKFTVKCVMKTKSDQTRTVPFKDLNKEKVNEIISQFGVELLLDKYKLEPCLFFSRNEIITLDCYANLPRGLDKANKSLKELCILINETQENCLRIHAERKIKKTNDLLKSDFQVQMKKQCESKKKAKSVKHSVDISQGVKEMIKKRLQKLEIRDFESRRIFELIQKTLLKIDKSHNSNEKLNTYMKMFIENIDHENINFVLKKKNSEIVLNRLFRSFVFAYMPKNITKDQKYFIQDILNIHDDKLNDMHITNNMDYTVNVKDVKALFTNRITKFTHSVVEKYISLLNSIEDKKFGKKNRNKIILHTDFFDTNVFDDKRKEDLLEKTYHHILIPSFLYNQFNLTILNFNELTIDYVVLGERIVRPLEAKITKIVDIFGKKKWKQKVYQLTFIPNEFWICMFLKLYLNVNSETKKTIELIYDMSEKFPQNETFKEEMLLELVSRNLGNYKRENLFVFEHFINFSKQENMYSKTFGNKSLYKLMIKSLENCRQLFEIQENEMRKDNNYNYMFCHIGTTCLLHIGSMKKVINQQIEEKRDELIINANNTYKSILKEIENESKKYEFDIHIKYSKILMSESKHKIDVVENSNMEKIPKLDPDIVALNTIELARKMIYSMSKNKIISIWTPENIGFFEKIKLTFCQDSKCDIDDRFSINFLYTILTLNTNFDTQKSTIEERQKSKLKNILYQLLHKINSERSFFTYNFELYCEICLSILMLENTTLIESKTQLLYSCYRILNESKETDIDFFSNVYVNILSFRVAMLTSNINGLNTIQKIKDKGKSRIHVLFERTYENYKENNIHLYKNIKDLITALGYENYAPNDSAEAFIKLCHEIPALKNNVRYDLKSNYLCKSKEGKFINFSDNTNEQYVYIINNNISDILSFEYKMDITHFFNTNRKLESMCSSDKEALKNGKSYDESKKHGNFLVCNVNHVFDKETNTHVINDNFKVDKLSETIHIPPSTYHLIGYILHIRSSTTTSTTGHFIVRLKRNNKWYEFDDNEKEVVEIQMEESKPGASVLMMIYSKKELTSAIETKMINLRNTGNTCYIDSLLVLLFNIPDIFQMNK